MLLKISDTQYRICGSLDIQHVGATSELIALGKSPIHHLTLDCQELTAADSLLLAVVLHLAREMEIKKGTLTIQNFPQRLASLAKTYGIDSLIDHYCSKE